MLLICSAVGVEEAMEKAGLITIGSSARQKVESSRQRLSNLGEVSLQQ